MVVHKIYSFFHSRSIDNSAIPILIRIDVWRNHNVPCSAKFWCSFVRSFVEDHIYGFSNQKINTESKCKHKFCHITFETEAKPHLTVQQIQSIRRSSLLQCCVIIIVEMKFILDSRFIALIFYITTEKQLQWCIWFHTNLVMCSTGFTVYEHSWI